MAALGGRTPAGALVFSCNGRGRGAVQRGQPRRRGGRGGARGRAGRGVLRGGRDRAGRRRPLPPLLHRDGRGLRLTGTLASAPPPSRRGTVLRPWTSRAGPSSSRAPPAASARRSRAGSPGAGRRSSLTGPPRGRARAAGRGDRRPRRRVRPRATPPRSTRCSTSSRTSTGWSPTRRCRRAATRQLQRRGDRPRAGREPAGADRDGQAARAADDRPPLGPHRLRLLAVRARRQRRRLGLLGDQVRPARLRPRLREDLRGDGVGVSVVLPGFIRDAGMFHDSGRSCRRSSARRRPRRSPRGVVSAIERDRAEIAVAPIGLRAGTAIAEHRPRAVGERPAAAGQRQDRRGHGPRPARQARLSRSAPPVARARDRLAVLVPVADHRRDRGEDLVGELRSVGLVHRAWR